jgi:hypothetical protein
VRRSNRQGRVVLVATGLYGGAALLLAHSPHLAVAVAAGCLLGGFDAMAVSVRHAAVQLDTPDELRGRVTGFYQMSSRGGPAIGDTAMGAFAGVVGPVAALTVGAFGPVLAAFVCWRFGSVVREYSGQAVEEAR